MAKAVAAVPTAKAANNTELYNSQRRLVSTVMAASAMAIWRSVNASARRSYGLSLASD